MNVSHDVFISYSHSTDSRLGPALEHGLEKLAKPLLQLRAMDAFIDRTSLAASPGLWHSIRNHLAGSKWFLILASPASAESQWCKKEIMWWLENRSADKLLIILTDGEIIWGTSLQDFDWTRTTALSDSLRSRFKDEPLFIDMRWAKNEKSLSLTNLRFRDSVVSIAAPIRGIRKDQLDSADIRQHRRNRLLVRIGVFMIMIAAGVAVWQAIVATKQRHEAEQQRDTAQARYLAIQAENAPSQEVGILLAIESLRRRIFIETDMLLRNFMRTQPAILSENLDPRVYSSNSSSVKMLSPKDTYFVTLDKLWRAKSKQPLKQQLFAHKKVFSQDEKYLAIASDKSVYLIALPDGERRLVLDDHYGEVSSLAFSPDSSKIAVGLWTNYEGIRNNRDGHIVIDVSSGQIVGGAVSNEDTHNIAFSPDGRYLATSGIYGSLMVWGAKDDFSSKIGHYEKVKQWTFAPKKDALFVLLESDGRLRVEKAAAGNESSSNWKYDAVDQFAVSPNGRILAISRNQFIELYDDKGKRLREMPLPYDNVRGMQFLDNKYLVLRWDKRMALFDVSRALQLVVMDQQFFPWNLDNSTIVTDESRSGKSLLKLWRIGGGDPLARMWHQDTVCTINFNHLGTQLVSASEDGTVRVWSVPDGKEIFLVKHNQPVTSAWFSPDGKTVVSAGTGLAMWWETETGRVLKRIKYRSERKPYFRSQGACFQDSHTLAVSFAGSTPLLAVATEHEEVDVHEFTNDTLLISVKHEMDEDRMSNRGHALRVAFGIDGKQLITANSNSERPIRTWNITTGQLVDTRRYAEAFTQYMRDIRWWPKRVDQKGRYIANLVDNQLIITENDSGSALIRLLHENGVNFIAVSPDESYIATAAPDGAVNLFYLKTGDLISDACRRVTKNLTKKQWDKYIGTGEYRKTCPSLPD